MHTDPHPAPTPAGHPVPASADLLTRWARPAPEMGPAVYQLTDNTDAWEYKHTYHIICPWSPDGRLLLLARYNRTDPEAAICVMDTADGRVREVGCSRNWEPHTAAFQQWQGNTGRLLYRDADDDGAAFVSCLPDGSETRRISTEGLKAMFCAPDGRSLYGGTDLHVLFPEDAIAPREDKGLIRVDLETGKRELVLSIEQTLSLVPDAKHAAQCHLYVKMIIVHPRLPRVMFNFTNTFWDRDGKEPRFRKLITVGTDGDNPRFVGPCAHHPNWHPIENRIVANVKDFTDTTRLGLYPGDGDGLLEYVPRTPGSGHPSFSPDGRWICTDAAGPEGNRMILCDPSSGWSLTLMECDFVSGGYASFNAVDKRVSGDSVMLALQRVFDGPITSWQTQAHPSWSRDGSAIVFNRDIGTGSQVFMVDVRKALAEGGR